MVVTNRCIQENAYVILNVYWNAWVISLYVISSDLTAGSIENRVKPLSILCPSRDHPKKDSWHSRRSMDYDCSILLRLIFTVCLVGILRKPQRVSCSTTGSKSEVGCFILVHVDFKPVGSEWSMMFSNNEIGRNFHLAQPCNNIVICSIFSYPLIYAGSTEMTYLNYATQHICLRFQPSESSEGLEASRMFPSFFVPCILGLHGISDCPAGSTILWSCVHPGQDTLCSLLAR